MALQKVTVAAATAALMLMSTAASEGTMTSSNVSGPRDPILMYIVEELPVGTLIGSVPTDAMLARRYDARQLVMLRYSLVTQKLVESDVSVGLFDIDDVTGIVRTAVRIDRDELCADRPICAVQLGVLVRPGPYSDLALASWKGGGSRGIKERYPRKRRYLTVVGQSFVKTVADRHGHAAYHNKH